MDYHVHGENNQLNGFYVINTQEESCKLLIHEPRSSKNILSLPIKPGENLTLAHNMVNYAPKAGDLIITNSWLPHSFTRNRSENAFEFVHININVIPNPNYIIPEPVPVPIIV
jgi:hypothetical protein